MKTSTLYSMIAVAALAVAASSASAQTFKAEIPMAFQASGVTMLAGSYEVRTASASPVTYVLYRRDASGVIVLGGAASDAPKKWLEDGAPRATFECLDGNCSLKSIWTGPSSSVQNFRSPKAPAGDVVAHRLQVVTLTMVKVH